MPRLHKLVLVALLVLGVAAACSRPAPPAPVQVTLPAGELVDLSHTYDASTIFWPTAETFALQKVADGDTPAGFYYAANNFSGSEHGGTHIDAPVHFARGHLTVDRIPLDALIARAVVIDVTQASAGNADYQATVDDLTRFEQQHGRIADGSILLIKTGFATRWPNAASYLGTAERGDAAVAKLHFPGLHPDAATWIAANRGVKAVGIDTASIDYGQSTLYETHRTLYARDIPALENLASLDRLPPTGALLIALPMKIGGGSGAPVRVVAVVPPSK
ncbi:MAG TPA: cyclase family protein [Vicinamibacterales bacterium]|nr:cyclase family protein [Vicinamibacterales bacterium]